jgi:hypothetical protein
LVWLRRTPSGALCGNIAMRDVERTLRGALADHASSDAGPSVRLSSDRHIHGIVPAAGTQLERLWPLRAGKGEGTGLGRDLGITGLGSRTSVRGQPQGLRPPRADGRCGDLNDVFGYYKENRSHWTKPMSSGIGAETCTASREPGAFGRRGNGTQSLRRKGASSDASENRSNPVQVKTSTLRGWKPSPSGGGGRERNRAGSDRRPRTLERENPSCGNRREPSGAPR